MGTFLVVLWLRLHASNAGAVGSIPGRGTKIPHGGELRSHIPCGVAKKKKGGWECDGVSV